MLVLYTQMLVLRGANTIVRVPFVLAGRQMSQQLDATWHIRYSTVHDRQGLQTVGCGLGAKLHDIHDGPLHAMQTYYVPELRTVCGTRAVAHNKTQYGHKQCALGSFPIGLTYNWARF